MNNFKINADVAIHSLLYVLNKLEKTSIYTALKVLYFADKEHLNQYGSTLFGGKYIAMENGPVHSEIYNLMKCVSAETYSQIDPALFNEKFKRTGNHNIEALELADTDELSESRIECLDKSIEENGSLSFQEAYEKSHDEAYEKTVANKGLNTSMDTIDIAIAANTDQTIITHITEALDTEKLLCKLFI